MTDKSYLKATLNAFPFTHHLSIAYLIDFWKQTMGCCNNTIHKGLLNEMMSKLDQAPELLEIIEDLQVLEKHQSILEVLMNALFPAASFETDLRAALVPFKFTTFYHTPSLANIFPIQNHQIQVKINGGEQDAIYSSTLAAYSCILQEVYGVEIDFRTPLIAEVIDDKTQLSKYFQLDFETVFCQLITKAKPPELSQEDIAYIKAHFSQVEMLLERIPPELFEFRGFTVLHAIEITDQELLSQIRRDLIEQESITSHHRFLGLQQRIRNLMGVPELEIILAGIREDQVYILNFGHSSNTECIYKNSMHIPLSDLTGSIYEKASQQSEPLVIGDLTKHSNPTEYEKELMTYGYRNVVIVPLRHQGEIIGVFGMKSPIPNAVTDINLMRLTEVTPLVTLAIYRSLAEFENRIQAMIQEKCTAIHPSVAWRFQQAAMKYVENQKKDGEREFEAIVFEEVYPLYSATDIRNSSTHRNTAIQKDLIDHLSMVKEIIGLSNLRINLPILDEFKHRVDTHLELIQSGLASGDEISIIHFIKNEIEPYFDLLKGFDSNVHEKIDSYTAALDPEIRTLYRQRKEFDDSVALINLTISSYLDQVQPEAQAMFPHFFDKQSTDGVDQNIYIGRTMNTKREFSQLYLKNLRLWQFIIMCRIARITEALKFKLKVTLDTTHLIVVQDMPITISFRMDEKRFSVDGAYNIRYEIMKKRIDKAIIRGSGERLTQPGQIAIVYSQINEAREYMQYIEYLQAKKYLQPGAAVIENLDLEDLQGIHGLKALRVQINYEQVQNKQIEDSAGVMVKAFA